MSWAQRDAERMEDHADEVTRLEAALAAMQKKRDNEKFRGDHFKAEYERGQKERNAAEAKLEAVELEVKTLRGLGTFPIIVKNLEAALAATGPSVRQRMEAVLESPDPCDEWAERGKDTDYTYEDGAIVEATRWRERLQQALATTGPSLRERVEKMLVQWREQKWIYTRGEVIRRTCIEEIEAAVKGE